MLTGAALASAGAAGMLPRMSAAAAPPGAVEYPVAADSTRVQGRGVGEDGGYGTRSQFQKEVRWRYPTPTTQSSWSMTPLEHEYGILTPSGLHFERHHGGVPTIDPAQHTLLIHGMVNQPRKFTMADPGEISLGLALSLHRMLGQWADRVVRAEAEDSPGKFTGC